MKAKPQNKPLWRAFPVIGFFASEWHIWQKERTQPNFRLAPTLQGTFALPPYPIDMWPLLALPFGTLDEVGVPYSAATTKFPAAYQPTDIAQYALAHWNAYLATGDEKHRQIFLIQAHWLVEHETQFDNDIGGWPLPFPNDDYCAPRSWLSAMTQGEGISVLVRAYRLTQEYIFLQVARRAVRTFELDILDGGVSASIVGNGVFFEEVAVYPAAHILNGYLFALFGLYDYTDLIDNPQISKLILRSLATFHILIGEFDTGFWSYYDLLFRHLAPPFYHALHVILLEALARYSGCDHCTALAARWVVYQHSLSSQIRYFITSRIARYRRGLRRRGIQGVLSSILRPGRHFNQKVTILLSLLLTLRNLVP